MAKVTSQNPFDLLGEADFDGEVQAPKVQPKKETAVAKPVAASASRPKNQDSRSSKDSKPRGPRPAVPRGGNADFETARAPRTTSEHKEKKAPRGRGNPRGRGRDFDRHSGTGRVDTEKAISQGWGHETENLEETANAETSDPKEAESPAAEVEANPEDNVKTLEEYYAELKAQKSQAEDNAKAIRKANEGADDSQWKGAVALKKDEEDFFTGKSSQSKARKQKEKSSKSFVEIEQKFAESNDRRNDRNERRPSRGGARGGQRGGQRGPKAESSRAVNLTDQSAFPSLGA